MNCKNFQYAQKARKGGCGEKPDCSMDSIYAESVSCDYSEREDYEDRDVRDREEFRDFLKMAEAIAEQEYRYRKFLAAVISAVSAILIFSGFFIFAKNRKVCKCEKTENSKI